MECVCHLQYTSFPAKFIWKHLAPHIARPTAGRSPASTAPLLSCSGYRAVCRGPNTVTRYRRRWLRSHARTAPSWRQRRAFSAISRCSPTFSGPSLQTDHANGEPCRSYAAMACRFLVVACMRDQRRRRQCRTSVATPSGRAAGRRPARSLLTRARCARCGQPQAAAAGAPAQARRHPARRSAP